LAPLFAGFGCDPVADACPIPSPSARGKGLVSRERYREAGAAFRKALESSPTYAEAHSNLGAMLEREGNSEEAIRHYRAAINNDGRIDIVVSNNNGPVRLLLNQTGPRGQWLEVRLQGVKSNRDGIGARVAVLREGRAPSGAASIPMGVT
jgi:tetratricopeptide (TPR) repeat protein